MTSMEISNEELISEYKQQVSDLMFQLTIARIAARKQAEENDRLRTKMSLVDSDARPIPSPKRDRRAPAVQVDPDTPEGAQNGS
jgi:hypothetical protein